MGRQRKASAQIFQRGDSFQTLLRVGGHRLRMRRQQPCVGLMVRAPDAPAQLVQLGQTEVIRTFDNDGVRRWNVDPGLNDGGTHQHVETLVVEIVHHPLQLALAHLAVTNGDARFRYQLCQPVGGFLNIFNVVIQVIHRRRAALRAGSPRAPPDCRTREQRFSPPDGAPVGWR